MLLLGGQFNHSPALLGIAEGSEDLPEYAKIRMVHMSAFDGFGQGQGQAAKIVGGHSQSP